MKLNLKFIKISRIADTINDNPFIIINNLISIKANTNPPTIGPIIDDEESNILLMELMDISLSLLTKWGLAASIDTLNIVVNVVIINVTT